MNWAMKMLAAIVVAMPLGLLAAAPGAAQQAGQAAEPETLVRQPPRHTRSRITVQPRYPYRRYHSLYPPPYDVEYPGPNAKRDCAVRYVTEYRQSGTVVVPRMNCRWVRG
jgi:hypothetical protein